MSKKTQFWFSKELLVGWWYKVGDVIGEEVKKMI